MGSCELDPGGEESEASPQHQCTKRETKSVRKATDCELKTYKRACWQRSILPFAGVQRYEEMKKPFPHSSLVEALSLSLFPAKILSKSAH